MTHVATQDGKVYQEIVKLFKLRLLNLLLASSLLLGAAPTNSPIQLNSPTYTRQTPVEQQSDYPINFSTNSCEENVRCVVNPTPCAWDVDDFWGIGSFGYMNPQTTVSVTVCEIADYNPVFLSLNGMEAYWSGPRALTGTEITAPSRDLIVTIRYAPQGKTFTLVPIASGRSWKYLWCGNVVYNLNDSALQSIPNSGRGTNGQDGLGFREDITLTVTNPTNKRIKGMFVGFGRTGTSPQSYGCNNITYWEPEYMDYPFKWWGATR